MKPLVVVGILFSDLELEYTEMSSARIEREMNSTKFEVTDGRN